MTSNKLITFCVPSYNSEAYLYRALDSLIVGGEEIEVLIIDDGSKDSTLEIAKDYERRYPHIFKAIHQNNKGHGGAINTALELASGKYFKVLDSDDWVKENGLKELLKTIRNNNDLDLIIMPYTYRHGENLIEGRTIRYNHSIKPNKVVSWKNVRRFNAQTNLTLHSVIYRTSLLREEINLILPEHTFYEDNYMIYAPLSHVNKIIYIDEPLYQYLLGREGQSMQTSIIIKRSSDLIRVSFLAFQATDLSLLKKTNYSLYKIMKHQLVMMTISALMYVSLKDEKTAQKEKGDFISLLKEENKKQYSLLHRTPYIFWSSFNNWLGKASSCFMLWVIRKFGAIN